MDPGLTDLVSKSIQNRQNPDNFCEVGVLRRIIFGNYCTETASTSTVLPLASEGLPVASDAEAVSVWRDLK